MAQGYFHRLNELSENRFWINNPTPVQAELAVAAGAVACTTNPTYGWKQLGHADTCREVAGYVEEAANMTGDDHEAADLVQQRCVRRILPYFAGIHEHSGGREGFVSIQGNPFRDDDTQYMAEEARRYRKMGANVIAKIPVTKAGLAAIKQLIAGNIPVIATEVMSLSQALATAEMYERTCKQSGSRPPFYLTHITGIFDRYVREEAESHKTDIHPDILWQAGIVLARKQYHSLLARGYDGIVMLGGGARGTHHFTELVGGAVHITINWNPTAEEILKENAPVIYRIDTPTPRFVLDELLTKVPAFRIAYDESGLEVEEFESFGPVRLFRSMFCRGWTNLVDAVRKHREQQQV